MKMRQFLTGDYVPRVMAQCRSNKLKRLFSFMQHSCSHSWRNRSVSLATAIIVILTVVYIHTGINGGSILCLNWTTQNAINKLCKQFKNGHVAGGLCENFCDWRKHRLTPSSCSRTGPHLAKEIAFTAVQRKAGVDTDVFIKSKYGDAERFDLYPYNLSIKDSGRSTFIVAIADILFHNFQISVDDFNPADLITVTDAETTFHTTNVLEENVAFSLWLLAQQKEYLLFKLYERSRLFPTVLSSCGHFYATEHLVPLTSLLHLNWNRRLAMVGSILRLLERAQVSFTSVLRICDVKLEHFGVRHVSDGRFGAVRLLDGDDVYFQSVLDSFQRHRNECRIDGDCSFFDCQARCHQRTGTCDSSTVNNNLQSVCEKMFVQRTALHRLFQPGILHSAPTPVARRIGDLAAVCRYDGRPSDFHKLMRKIKNVLMLDKT